MPGSVISVFSEQNDFETALRTEGCLSFVLTARQQFRARLTQVTLHGLRLSSVEEQVPRIAFVAVPSEMVLVVLPSVGKPAPVWAGHSMQDGELAMIGPGRHVHARADDPCRWGALWLPLTGLTGYGQAMTGATVSIPPLVRCWRPQPAHARRLRALHEAAIRGVGARREPLINANTAHGLEQQVVEAVIECLPLRPCDADNAAARRERDIMRRFGEALLSERHLALRVVDLCAAIGVSDRGLRAYCQAQLGMGPGRYIHLRRMHQARRTLRSTSATAASISDIAHRYGFHDERRFAANYRALFGEMPRTTLCRGEASHASGRTTGLNGRRFDDI